MLFFFWVVINTQNLKSSLPSSSLFTEYGCQKNTILQKYSIYPKGKIPIKHFKMVEFNKIV